MLSRSRATHSLSLSLDDSRDGLATLCAGDEERAERVLRRLYTFLDDHLACLIEDADVRLWFMQIDTNIFRGWSSLLAALTAFLWSTCYHVVQGQPLHPINEGHALSRRPRLAPARREW
jgi:hypothetical protein